MRIPLYYCIAGVALVTLLNLAVFEKVVIVLIDSESSPIRSVLANKYGESEPSHQCEMLLCRAVRSFLSSQTTLFRNIHLCDVFELTTEVSWQVSNFEAFLKLQIGGIEDFKNSLGR